MMIVKPTLVVDTLEQIAKMDKIEDYLHKRKLLVRLHLDTGEVVSLKNEWQVVRKRLLLRDSGKVPIATGIGGQCTF